MSIVQAWPPVRTDIFCNPRLLTNILTTTETMTIHCNAGTQTTNQKGTLRGYGEVWYSGDAIANILSLTNVSVKHPVRFDKTG